MVKTVEYDEGGTLIRKTIRVTATVTTETTGGENWLNDTWLGEHWSEGAETFEVDADALPQSVVDDILGRAAVLAAQRF